MIIFCQIRSWSVIVFRNGRSVALSNLIHGRIYSLTYFPPSRLSRIPSLIIFLKNIQCRVLTRLSEMVALLLAVAEIRDHLIRYFLYQTINQ